MFSLQYPLFSRNNRDLEVENSAYCMMVSTPVGPHSVPNMQIIGIINKYMIVSCKHTQNLFVLTSFWKTTVLTRLDRDAIEPEENLRLEMDGSSFNFSETDPGYLFQVINYI
jgi:hypothetical protein